MYHWLINIEFTASSIYSTLEPSLTPTVLRQPQLSCALMLGSTFSHTRGHFQEHKEQACESPAVKTSQKRPWIPERKQCHLVPCYDSGLSLSSKWPQKSHPSDLGAFRYIEWGVSERIWKQQSENEDWAQLEFCSVLRWSPTAEDIEMQKWGACLTML